MTRFARRILVLLLFSAFAISPLGGFATPAAAQSAQPIAAKKEQDPAGDPAEERKPLDDKEYFELMLLFADTLDQIERNYVKKVSRRELMEAAIRGLLTKLDPHSNYIPPKDLDKFRTDVENQFGGIGITVTVEEGHLKIISPIVGSPAYRAGLQAGDKIIKIEGEGTKDITLNEAVRKLKGPVGTKVSFTVLHPADDSTRTVTLRREIVRVRTVLGDKRKESDQWDFMLDDERKIAYIRITGFGRQTPGELRDALQQLELQGMKGLILDLRFNPGGLLSAAIKISDMFVTDGVIVSTSGRNVREQVWRASGKGTFTGFPITILVNRYSASASEIVSACLQDHKRAVVIGSRSFGKGSVQNIIELEGGRSALKLTTAGYKRPSGKNIHRFPDAKDSDEWGVKPDPGFEVTLTAGQMSKLLDVRRKRDIIQAKDSEEKLPPAFDDPQLERAIKYIQEKIGGKTRKPTKDLPNPPSPETSAAK